MKNKTAFLLIAALIFSQTAFASAASPGHKLVRGIEGILTSPMEYINQYKLGSHNQSPIAGVTIAIFGGTAMTIKRIINGVYDVISFPVNLPKDYGLLLGDETETALQNYNSLQNSKEITHGL